MFQPSEIRFVSDIGRPGYCATPFCNHMEFSHAPDGPCRECGCARYDPLRFFDDE